MFKAVFEVEVVGLSTTKRFDGVLYINADTPKAAKDKAELYIKNAYSETFAILEVVPMSVIE